MAFFGITIIFLFELPFSAVSPQFQTYPDAHCLAVI